MFNYKILEKVFAKALNKPLWNTRPGYGTFVTAEIGRPTVEIYRPIRSDYVDGDVSKPLNRRRVVVRGQWRLWIYGCNWQVSHRGKRIGGSAQIKSIPKAVAALDGQALVAVSVNPTTGSSIFKFDLGGVMSTMRESKSDDQWLLYCPSGKVFVFRGDGSYSYESGDATPSEKEWKRFVGSGPN